MDVDDLIVRAKRTAVGLRTWDHPNEANLMEDLADELEHLRATIEQVSHIAYDPFISDGEALTRIQDLTDANLPPGEVPPDWLPEVPS